MFKETLKNIGAKAFNKFEEHSPEIALGVGIASMVGATIFACKGTIKAKKALEDYKDDMETISKTEERGYTYDDDNNEVEYSHDDSLKDRSIVLARTGMLLVKAYGPAVILTGVGIACLISGHHILRKRNLALAAAYSSMSEAYKKYQEKVKELLGETAARDLKYGLKQEEVLVDTGKTNKDGTPKTKKEKRTIFTDRASVLDMSPYARFWDEGCAEYTGDPAYDLTYLRHKQSWYTDLLRLRGKLTLNEVYRDLGYPETREGCLVGWSLSNPKSDDYVDLGIYNSAYTPNRDFVNGYEPVCLLDPNVVGLIIDDYPTNEEVQNRYASV